MDLSCLVSTVRTSGGGVMVWGVFSWHTLVVIDHRLNATAYLSIIADHVHPCMTTMYPSSDATSSWIMHHVTKPFDGNSNLQLPLQIFYRINVWRLARSLQDLNVLLLEPLLCCLGGMFRVTVMLEDPSTAHLQCSG